jgi:L-aspartate oxidase
MKPVVIGTGLAGLSVALSLAPMPVTLIAGRKLGEATSSGWAQGGIAAAVGLDDNPTLHAEDTIKAGAGLCDPAIVQQVTEDAPAVIEWLAKQGAQFDRGKDGRFNLGLEAAHSRRRIVHANGDGTGNALMKVLIAKVRATPTIEIIEDAMVTQLIVGDGIEGVEVRRGSDATIIPTRHAVLATGGAGALWLHTTNPLGSWGAGFVLAARAGAILADLEFMQFHPTGIDIGQDPMPLASETLRGEGATLIDEKGKRFMGDYAHEELEPRDVVARAIWAHMSKRHRVFLDARMIKDFATRFPGARAICAKAGLDPSTMPIPVRPAAHYHMGGVATDAYGRSSVKGLWACGEVASTGLHGANRLASNSLLEATSFGYRVAVDIAAAEGHDAKVLPPPATQNLRNPAAYMKDVRAVMSGHVGVLRDELGLDTAIQRLKPLAAHSDVALAGLLIAMAALRRTESRGAQARADHPETSADWQRRQFIKLDDVLPASERPTTGNGHAA